MISTFRSISDRTPVNANLQAILQGVKEGRWAELVRPVAAETDKRKRAALKKKLPSFTVSGTFASNTDNSLIQHSGFIAMDFDDPSPYFAEQLGADKYTYAMFRSVSGLGFCVIVRIDPLQHEASFYALADYYRETYNEVADPSCSNVSRKRFVSFDPDLVLNENAAIFVLPQKKHPPKTAALPIHNVPSDFERLVEAVVAARKDLTATYKQWVFVGMACRDYNSGPLGLQLFKALSQFHPHYNPQACERKWRQLPNPHTVKLTYIFEAAPREGIVISNPLADEIAAAVHLARESGKSADEAIQILSLNSDQPLQEEYLDFAQTQFKEAKPPKKLKPLQLARQFLNQNTELWECDITRKVYDGKTEITERYVNMLWEQCNNKNIRITADNLSRLIFSAQNPRRNAIRDWLAALQTPGIDAIDQMVQSLPISHEFGFTLINKWLVSIISNVFTERAMPYMLVLCGAQNTGKTSWFRGLLPPEMQQWYAESRLEEGKDDLRLLTEKIIVLNDEFTGRTVKEVAMYKDILSKNTFTFRVPYGRSNEQFKRIASLAGTSNPTEIISDLTGNRRIFPVEVVEPVNWNQYNAVDRNRFWGQLYNIWKEGYKTDLTPQQIITLNEYSEQFSEAILEEDLIRSRLQPDPTGHGMTTTDILLHFEAHTRTRLGLKKIGLAMHKLGYIQKVTRVDNQSLRLWNCKPKHL